MKKRSLLSVMVMLCMTLTQCSKDEPLGKSLLKEPNLNIAERKAKRFCKPCVATARKVLLRLQERKPLIWYGHSPRSSSLTRQRQIIQLQLKMYGQALILPVSFVMVHC